MRQRTCSFGTFVLVSVLWKDADKAEAEDTIDVVDSRSVDDTIIVGSHFVVPAVNIAVDDWFSLPVVGILDIVTASELTKQQDSVIAVIFSSQPVFSCDVITAS